MPKRVGACDKKFSRRTNNAQQFNSTTEDHHFNKENDVSVFNTTGRIDFEETDFNATERIDFNANEENNASDTATERIDFNANEENNANDVNTERINNEETDNAANKPPEADDPESSTPTDNQFYNF